MLALQHHKQAVSLSNIFHTIINNLIDKQVRQLAHTLKRLQTTDRPELAVMQLHLIMLTMLCKDRATHRTHQQMHTLPIQTILVLLHILELHRRHRDIIPIEEFKLNLNLTSLLFDSMRTTSHCLLDLQNSLITIIL